MVFGLVNKSPQMEHVISSWICCHSFPPGSASPLAIFSRDELKWVGLLFELAFANSSSSHVKETALMYCVSSTFHRLVYL